MSRAQDRFPASNADVNSDSGAGVRPGGGRGASLSRRWRLAVITAGGLATAVTTTALLPATAAVAPGTRHTLTTDLQAPVHPGTAPSGGDAPDQDQDRDQDDDRDADYWAQHAGNPDEHRTTSTQHGKDEDEEQGRPEHGKGEHEDGAGERGRPEQGKDEDRGGGEDGVGERGRSQHGKGRGGGGSVVSVACDPNALIAAMTVANGQSGGRLSLAPDCTYTLTANDGANGLPVVVQRMVIDGNGATIARAANADPFRIFSIGTGGDLKLRHLTVTRGRTAGSGSTDVGGGGAYVDPGGRLDIDHVTFANNTVNDAGSGSEENNGGAIYNEGTTTLRNSTIRNNSATLGGGIYNSSGKLEITTSRFTGNASSFGGAVNALAGSTTIAKSLFKSNAAAGSGGAFYTEGGRTDIDKSTFLYNRASSASGGAISAFGPLEIRRSTIGHNTAPFAGGVYPFAGGVIADSTIHDNVATNSNGGAVFMGADLALQRTVVTGNRAPRGSAGGIYIGNGTSTLDLTDSTITDNSSADAPGGIYNRFDATVNAYGTNTITDNTPTNCTGVSTTICFG
ncbi:hypothetical protein [Streptomyces sp. C10-9-1]|uniref:hypothetical protein n=1 Tax=Streptomyces sp. C10-9-1 TaxID=1859285 RepID=UPI003D73E975